MLGTYFSLCCLSINVASVIHHARSQLYIQLFINCSDHWWKVKPTSNLCCYVHCRTRALDRVTLAFCNVLFQVGYFLWSVSLKSKHILFFRNWGRSSCFAFYSFTFYSFSRCTSLRYLFKPKFRWATRRALVRIPINLSPRCGSFCKNISAIFTYVVTRCSVIFGSSKKHLKICTSPVRYGFFYYGHTTRTS